LRKADGAGGAGNLASGAAPLPAGADAVVLVGFMGAGKSTVGRELAALTGRRFVDLDREIERLAGASIPEIFRTRGVAGFRALEVEATNALTTAGGLVLAAGGGWFIDPHARARINGGAFIVWLRVSAAEAMRRIGAGAAERPLLATDEPDRTAAGLLAEREPFYALADASVETEGRSPADIAREIARMIPRP
jgi:shikimate kinase